MQQVIKFETVLRSNDSSDTENKIRKGSSMSKYRRNGKIRLGESKKKHEKIIKPIFILRFKNLLINLSTKSIGGNA